MSSGRSPAGFARQAARIAFTVLSFWAWVVTGSTTKPIQLGTAEYCTATLVTSPPVTISIELIASGSIQPVPVAAMIAR